VTDYNLTVKADVSAATASVAELNDQIEGLATSSDAAGESASAIGANLAQSASEATPAVSAVNDGVAKLSQSLQSMQQFAGQAFAFVGVSLGVDALIHMNDAAITASNALHSLTNSTEAYNQVSKDLLGIADQSRQSFDGVVSLYQRVDNATQGMHVSSSNLLLITQTLTEALSLSGQSAEGGGRAILGLTLAMQGGAAGGARLGLTLQRFQPLLAAMEESSHKTAAELSKLVGPELITAIEKASGALNDAFVAGFIPVNQAMTVFKNNFADAFTDLGNKTGAFQALSDVIIVLANHMSIVLPIILALGGALATLTIVAGVSTAFDVLSTAATALKDTFWALNASLLANPFVLIAAGLTLLILAIPNLSGAVETLLGWFKELGDWFDNNILPGLKLIAQGFGYFIQILIPGINILRDVVNLLAYLTGNIKDNVEALGKGATGFTQFGDAAGHAMASLNALTKAQTATTTATTNQTAANHGLTTGMNGDQYYIDQYGKWQETLASQINDTNKALAAQIKLDAALAAAAKESNVGASVLSLQSGNSYVNTYEGEYSGFASGGNMPAGQIAMVGENGPELIVPSTSGIVVPATTTETIMKLAKTLASTIFAQNTSTLDPITGLPTGLTPAGSSAYQAGNSTFAQLGALQNVFGGGFGNGTGASGAAGGPNIGTPDILPKDSTYTVSQLSTAFANSLFQTEANEVNLGVQAGQITGAQGTAISQVLSESIADWQTYQAKGPDLTGLYAGSNGFYGYFKDVRKMISQYSWLKNFVGQAFGAQFAAGIMDPAPVTATSSSTAGTSSGVSDSVSGAQATLAAHIADGSWQWSNTTALMPNGLDIREVLQVKESIGGTPQWVDAHDVGLYQYDQFAPSPGFVVTNAGKFATGGQFNVGGAGGTDSQLVQFLASPDETVTVQTPSQRKSMAEATAGVTVNMTINTPDANSFGKSQTQIINSLKIQLDQITARVNQ